MKFVLALITVALSYSALAEDANQKKTASQWISNWQEERSEGPISATCRQHSSKIKQCKFTAIVDEPAEALSAVVLDVENFKEWAISVNVSDRVNYPDDNDIYVYTTYEFVGAYNRDALTRYTAELNDQKDTVKVKFLTVDHEIEKRDMRLVRFPLMAGYWQFKKLDDGKTEIEHLSFTLPGGVVQSTLYPIYNMGYVDSSFDTIRALQKQSKKPKYLAASIASLNIPD